MAARGQPKTGGRVKGTPNKGTADVKAIALSYAPQAIATLVRIATDEKAPHAAQVAASKELLDRGVGKSIQTQIVSAEVTTTKTLRDFYGESHD